MKHELWWKGECVDEFDTKEEVEEMQEEYNIAFNGGVTIRENSSL